MFVTIRCAPPISTFIDWISATLIPPPMRPVLTEDRIARERFSAIEIRQSGRGSKFGFLDACYKDLLFD